MILATEAAADSTEDDHEVEDVGSPKYDVFVSYAHADSQAVNFIIQALSKEVPNIRLFVDRKELHTGESTILIHWNHNFTFLVSTQFL